MKPVLVLTVMAVFGAASSEAAQASSAAGGQAQMVRAAGMSLRDGALPPGSLTVRIVEGAFTGDVTGIPVHLEIIGGETKQEMTGAQGRAAFAHLPVGAQVKAFATVNNERLESEMFTMPTDSGVRVLLVAGAEAGPSPTSGAVQALPPMAPAMPTPVAPARAGSSSPEETGATVVRAVMVVATVGVVLFVGMTAMRRRRL